MEPSVISQRKYRQSFCFPLQGRVLSDDFVKGLKRNVEWISVTPFVASSPLVLQVMVLRGVIASVAQDRGSFEGFFLW
jgi:hypothetical protein